LTCFHVSSRPKQIIWRVFKATFWNFTNMHPPIFKQINHRFISPFVGKDADKSPAKTVALSIVIRVMFFMRIDIEWNATAYNIFYESKKIYK